MMNAQVLLVCDDAVTERIWAYALDQDGVQVVLAGSAEEALDRSAAEIPDLIIIDVDTPRLGGLDLCRRFRGEAVNPILLLTPHSAEAHLLEAYQAGVDECVV